VLSRRGFKNVKDLSKLEEGDMDFKCKPVHRTRLLWVATTQKLFLTEDGEKLPEVEKIKVGGDDSSFSTVLLAFFKKKSFFLKALFQSALRILRVPSDFPIAWA